MASIRLRFRDGVFVPIDDIPVFEEGEEVEVVIVRPYRYTPEQDEHITAAIEKVRGIWADLDVDLSDIVTEEGPTARDQ